MLRSADSDGPERLYTWRGDAVCNFSRCRGNRPLAVRVAGGCGPLTVGNAVAGGWPVPRPTRCGPARHGRRLPLGCQPTTGATLPLMRTRSLLAAALLSVTAAATATTVGVGGEWGAGVWPAPYGPWLAPYGYPLPAPGAFEGFGRCFAPRNCADYEQMRRFLDRYQRNYGARFAPDAPSPAPPWPQREVPPTAADQIQPAYRNASQIRPEFSPGRVPAKPPAASR